MVQYLTGVNVGLGGAVPLAPFYEPVQQAVLPNGNYTISNIALSGCASGNVMSGGTCNQGNLVTVGLAGKFLSGCKSRHLLLGL